MLVEAANYHGLQPMAVLGGKKIQMGYKIPSKILYNSQMQFIAISKISVYNCEMVFSCLAN